MEPSFHKIKMTMGTGYMLCTDEQIRKKLGKRFYKIYHSIICSQISVNNIEAVNGLIRWIDVIGFFPNNKLLFEYALLNGKFEMFLMIYYICLFWLNEDDDKEYLNYNHINHLMNDVKK